MIPALSAFPAWRGRQMGDQTEGSPEQWGTGETPLTQSVGQEARYPKAFPQDSNLLSSHGNSNFDRFLSELSWIKFCFATNVVGKPSKERILRQTDKYM